MTNKIGRFISLIIGAIIGFVLIYSFDVPFLRNSNVLGKIGIYTLSSIGTALIFYLIFPLFYRAIYNMTKRVELQLKKISGADLLLGIMGLFIGLLLAFLISQPLYRLQGAPFINVLIVLASIIIFVTFGILGIRVALNNKDNIVTFFSSRKKFSKYKEDMIVENQGFNPDQEGTNPKILDTSVIIDGRIKDILETGFIEGELIVPIFVLEELQHIADSEKDIRRIKGRRGLDVLKLIQSQPGIKVRISSERYPQIEQVDSKILKLAIDLNAKVLTNDYNLNKVAKVQGIDVLNINELANAMKPIVFPGESMQVQILKEGKEANQGVAYLDDGTMVVVENGRDHIGEEVSTTVTSVLQTAAGKMIFVRIKD